MSAATGECRTCGNVTADRGADGRWFCARCALLLRRRRAVR